MDYSVTISIQLPYQKNNLASIINGVHRYLEIFQLGYSMAFKQPNINISQGTGSFKISDSKQEETWSDAEVHELPQDNISKEYPLMGGFAKEVQANKCIENTEQ